jgi:phosphomannomutase
MQTKKLVLFDIDGTLTESAQLITSDVKNSLGMLITSGYHIGIVGGGRLDIILKQLDTIYFNHYFSECGCVYHKNSSNTELSLVEIYKKNLRDHILYPSINILIKTALLFLSQVDYTITGHFIDLRNGIVYISLLGINATIDERNCFMKLNEIHHYRKQLIELLIAKTKELNIYDNIYVAEGGSIGIAIYPSEYDKNQVVEHLSDDYDEIHYVGDKYNFGGNDHKIINHPNIIGHRVDSINDTIKTINTLSTLIMIKN